MSDLRERIESYLSQLSGPRAEDAWHALVEAGPSALPSLASAIKACAEPALRSALVEVVSQYRVDGAIPILATALQEDDPRVWHAALDGIVTLGSSVALEALNSARKAARAEKVEWIDEAIEQIQARRAPV